MADMQGTAAPVAENNEQIQNKPVENKQPENPFKNHKEKLKINGKEREISYDEMKRLASMSAASDERFKSAKQMSDEAKQLKSAFESGNIVEALGKLGKSPKEIRTMLEDHLLDFLEQDSLDPKEKELRDLKKFKEQAEKEQADLRKRSDDEKMSKEVERQRLSLENELVGAIKDSNLPKNTMVFQKVAREMESALINGYEMKASEAVKIVEQELIEEYSALLPHLGAERLKKALGKDMLKLLQEEQVRAVKESEPSFAKQREKAPQKKPTSKESDDEKIPMGSFFRGLTRKY